MKRSTVKAIFWFFILFLPLQYAAVGIVGVLKSEPWPALVLPGFKSVYDQDGEIVLTHVRFFALAQDATNSLKIEPALLFDEIEESQILGFLGTHFSDTTQIFFTPAAKHWMKNRIRQIYPEWDGWKLRVEWIRKYYQYEQAQLQLKKIEITKSYMIPLRSERE